MSKQPSSMRGVLLPGDRRVVMEEFPVPEPGHGQVLVEMKGVFYLWQRYSRHLS